jgi:MFS family permease
LPKALFILDKNSIKPAHDTVKYTVSDLLARRDFMRLWYSRLAGTAANQMLMVALGWQMYDLTSSAWDLGLVGLAQFLPALLLSLVAGLMIDRFNRSRIVAACLLLQAVAACVLLWSTQGQWLSRDLILGMSVLLGTARAFQMPAQQALTPMLVPTQMLPRAMAFSSVGLQTAIIGGPALGGLLFAVGAMAVYGTCLALLLVGSLFALALKVPTVPRVHEPTNLRALLAGVAFVWQRKVILGALSLDLFAVLLGGATALLPMFAKDILHVGPFGLGILRAAPAAGALLASLVLTRWPLERQVGQRMLMAVGTYGLSTLIFGISTNYYLSFIMLAISGCADMVSVVVRQTLVQLETPDNVRGRVGSVNSVFIGASNQLGEFESGATAAALGPVGSVVLGGLGTLVIALSWTKLFPALAKRDRLTG